MILRGPKKTVLYVLSGTLFLVQAYYCRGIARQSQDNYHGALSDYNKGLEFKPEDRQMLVNKAVANIQMKDFKSAESVFDKLMVLFPKYTVNYLTRGAMYLEKGDSIQSP